MAQKIQYATIIFPDHVYEEIQLLQKELSYKYNKIWSISNTINLLLRFCLHEENDVIYVQNYSFLREYTYGRVISKRLYFKCFKIYICNRL